MFLLLCKEVALGVRLRYPSNYYVILSEHNRRRQQPRCCVYVLVGYGHLFSPYRGTMSAELKKRKRERKRKKKEERKKGKEKKEYSYFKQERLGGVGDGFCEK